MGIRYGHLQRMGGHGGILVMGHLSLFKAKVS